MIWEKRDSLKTIEEVIERNTGFTVSELTDTEKKYNIKNTDKVVKLILKAIEDKNNPFCTLYEYETGDRFYIEPLFYTYLENFKIQFPHNYQQVIDEMEKIVKRNHRVIFTGMDEEYEDEPLTKNKDAIFLTIYDILNKLQIYVEDKSRGSDYGD